MNWIFKVCALFLVLANGLFSGSPVVYAQTPLNRIISINANRQPISSVLRTISENGNFYFSYNSDILKGDSLITTSVRERPVRVVLDNLLGERYQFKENGNYIIILRAPKERSFFVVGKLSDGETLSPVDFASVYSRKFLISALTDDQGIFRLRVRDAVFPFQLTVSKVGYGDTTVTINRDQAENISVTIFPRPVLLDPLIVRFSEGDGSWLSRLFLSERLRAQSRNIGQFFVSLPYQASLTPGLGTHGKMSGQVVNKFSLNLLGGYTAGVNGLELAGGFNISKTDVRYAQVAGIFNLVSGNLSGVQLAGLHNHVGDSLRGVQVSGFSGLVRKNMRGVQLSGFLSKSAGTFRGVQMSGAVSLAKENSRGVQVSGLANYTSAAFGGLQIAGGVNRVGTDLRGGQLAGLANVSSGKASGFQLGPINYARHLKGVQFGLINVADSSTGCSIGLINIIRHGNSNISMYANELAPINLAWKMGNHQFYSILFAGSGINASGKVYAFGVGAGRAFNLDKSLEIFAEITNQNLYMGSWENMPFVLRLQTGLNVRLTSRIQLIAGPAVNFFVPKSNEQQAGYKAFPLNDYPGFSLGGKAVCWFGWQGGISWRYGR